MVEFAMAAPLGFLLLLGIAVLGIVLTHQIQLNQAVKSSARAVAVRGGAARHIPTLPAGCRGRSLPTGIPPL
jgi:Flp pilus assembly protein TadG